MDPIEEVALNEWAGEPLNKDFEIEEGLSSRTEAGISAPSVSGFDGPSGWLGASSGEASEHRESVSMGADKRYTNK